jgi:hypothetical protein
MADSHFFMTRDDSTSFVVFLMEKFSAEFVPERSTCPPPFPRYTTLAEVQARIDRNVHRFAVLSTSYELVPLAFHETHANDGQRFFSLRQRFGGPAFDLILSRTWTDGEQRWTVPGSFGDYPYYYVDDAFLADRSSPYRTMQRPVAMAAAHKEVRKYLRRHGRRSVCREDGRAGPWILLGALREFEAGLWLRIGDWHLRAQGRDDPGSPRQVNMVVQTQNTAVCLLNPNSPKSPPYADKYPGTTKHASRPQSLAD